MTRKHYRKLIILTFAIFLAGMPCLLGAQKSPDGTGISGGRVQSQKSPELQQAKTKSLKQFVAGTRSPYNASGLDHTPVAPGENRVFGEQIGPGRASRAMAIVHIAIFDAVNAITGGSELHGSFPRVDAALR